MEAAEALVRKVLEGTKQFVVPHFQRPYAWREEQWRVLWTDLIDRVESEDRVHVASGNAFVVDEKLVDETSSSALPHYFVDWPASPHGDELGVAYNNFSRGGNKPHILCINQQAIFTQLLTPAQFEAAHQDSQKKIPAACARIARVDAKCKEDPSLAVAHCCFWKYHPAKAYAWELRLQHEMEDPTFTIDEPNSDAARETFLGDHPEQARDLEDKEAKRRARKAKGGDDTAPRIPPSSRSTTTTARRTNEVGARQKAASPNPSPRFAWSPDASVGQLALGSGGYHGALDTARARQHPRTAHRMTTRPDHGMMHRC